MCLTVIVVLCVFGCTLKLFDAGVHKYNKSQLLFVSFADWSHIMLVKQSPDIFFLLILKLLLSINCNSELSDEILN